MTTSVFDFQVPDISGRPDGTNWVWDQGNQLFKHADTSSPGSILWPIAPRPGAAIGGCVVRLAGGRLASHSARPSSLPVVNIFRQDDLGLTQIGPAGPDLSPDVTSYNAAHEIVLACSLAADGFFPERPPFISPRYLIRLLGESGSNVLNNATVVLAVTVLWQPLVILPFPFGRQI